MFRNLFFALVLSIVMIGCDSSDLILDDVLLTDADKGTLYINPDNVPSAYSRYPAGDFTVDIPEDILFKIGSYNSGLFHGDRIYYTYKEYDYPGNDNTVNGGGIVFCDKNGKYLSHREITFPESTRRFPLRWNPGTIVGVYQNNLILTIGRYRDLFAPYDSVWGSWHTVMLNLDTFEFTHLEGDLLFPSARGSVRSEFVIGDTLYMRRSPDFVGEKYWDQSLPARLYAYSLVLLEYTPEHDITINHGYQFDWQIAGEPPVESDSFIIDIDDTRNDLSAQLAKASFEPEPIKHDGIGGLWVNVLWDFIINQDLKACGYQAHADNFLAKFDMQGNFTGEIVDIDSTCEDFQTYNRNVPIFPQGSDGEFLYFPAWDPNKGINWVWKPYKYICYKRN